MRASSLRRPPTLVDVGPAGYQEFTAGTIPVRGVMADEEGTLVLVEHRRGFMRAFDEHLSAVHAGGAPRENVDYTVTWTAITGWEPWPPVVRLELKIDGLNARPRLLFRGETMLPLWLLADGACLGLIVHPRTKGWVSASSCIWTLGPTPAARGLARILGELGVPRPIMPARAGHQRGRNGRTGRSRRRRRRTACELVREPARRRPTNIESISEGEDHA
jgi:hypothetical protein